MIEWYWLLAVGVAAVGIGYFFGGRIVRRAAELEIGGATKELDTLRSRSAAATDKSKALALELESASARAERSEQESQSLSPQVAALTSTVAGLKQESAEANTARRAADAALALKETEHKKAIEQATASRKAAGEASDKYDAITGEFVSLKRALREALDGLARTQRERDAMAAEAKASQSQAETLVAETERSRDAAVASANAERDQAIAAAEAASQRRADAGTLRNEIMSAQRELADLRDELAGKDRHIRDLEGRHGQSTPASATVVGAFSGFDPEAGSAVSDADMEAVLDTAPPVPEVGNQEAEDAEPDDQGQLDDDDDIFTVDDLPGGDWEPDEAVSDAPLGPVGSEDATTTAPEPAGEEPGNSDTASDDPEDEETQSAPETAAADPDVPDNLRLVKGIGPKFESMLHARDITAYEQIAALTDDTEWETYLDTFAGRIEREQWREQAVVLIRERDA